ncbi:MAG: hypothetical protein ABH878_08180 [bacterium]
MPPKTQFSPEDVAQAAFDVVREQGIEALSARRVALRLKSSVAPVYTCFNSMSELKQQVLLKARDLLYQYTTTTYTSRVFLNIGTGMVLFARDHRQLFRALFLTDSDHRVILDELFDVFKMEMRNDARLVSLSDSECEALLTKMWIFTHGLASLICVGLIEDHTQNFIVETLSSVGSLIIQQILADSLRIHFPEG